MQAKPGWIIFLTTVLLVGVCGVYADITFTPPVADDPLFRMPGTQPSVVPGQGAFLTEPAVCINCHGERAPVPGEFLVTPGFSWNGAMMAQAARDPIFWACMVVAGQDSAWALGNPNAMDLCLRCHFPEGWLAGRSGHVDPTDLNASAMIDSDYDGVHCDFCHRMWDPFFQATFNGVREGADWQGYWDEFNNTGPLSGTDAQNGAEVTLAEDQVLAAALGLFNGNAFYSGNFPAFNTYTENGGGQYFVSSGQGFLATKRANFADGDPDHTVLYSRYHRSKFFCSTCHDVSNPVLANLNQAAAVPGDGVTVLSTENQPAYSYGHVERTFSEFMVSAYAQQGGAPGKGAFAPGVFDTNLPYDYVGRCQDCHMPGVEGKGCEEESAPLRPVESTEHPNSGAPFHDQQGGNLWMTRILASLDDHFPEYDSVNYDLLVDQVNGPLTVDMFAGIFPLDNGEALLAASDRAREQLQRAASIENLAYNPANGDLSFRIQNNTGHKLISGFPEGRRMFANIRAYQGGTLIYEINPYDYTVGTLKGLDPDKVPSSPDLAQDEAYVDDLVYEVHPISNISGAVNPKELEKTFHFVLATDRYKDNRIPALGFDLLAAPERLVEPVWEGKRDCFGNFDNNGAVNVADLSFFAAAFGSNMGDANYNPEADFNGDGTVNVADLSIFAAYFGRTDCSETPIFTAAELAGGYDDVHLADVRKIELGPGTDLFPSGADRVEVVLYYQGTSREYVEFLRDEINGFAAAPNFLTLPPEAYIVQTDGSGFFNNLRAWGDTIWELWHHNHGLDGSGASVDGIVPVAMTEAVWLP